MLLCCRSVVPPHIQQALVEARDEVLGPRDQRTSSKSDGRDGTYVGGTAFEREERPTSVHEGRAYTLACSDQQQNSVYSPVAWGKLPRNVNAGEDPACVDELPHHRRLRALYLKARLLLPPICRTYLRASSRRRLPPTGLKPSLGTYDA